jgi:hypothetical protein
MQTNTVVRSSADFVITRVAPLAEAPRPAREQIDGRFPGLRVGAPCRLPEPSVGRSSVALGRRSPRTVAGAAVVLFRESRDPRSSPHSLFALLRETINQTREYTVATLACQWSHRRTQASMGDG